MKRRRVVRGSCFDLHYLAAGLPKSRLGLIIPKRYAKASVLRNLIRRQVREFFRHQSGQLPSADFVFRLVRPLNGLPAERVEQKRWVVIEVQKLFAAVAKTGD